MSDLVLIPNYLLFVALSALFVGLTIRFSPKRRGLRNAFLLVVALWCFLEHLRWFSYLDWTSPSDRMVNEMSLEAFGLMMLSASLLFGSAKVANRAVGGFMRNAR
jgi:hypothetical protein